MSEVIAISEDHRKTLIDIFFSVMISDAIGQFVSRFLLGDSSKPSFFFFLDFINNYIQSYVNINSLPNDSPEHWLDALFFAATFFWIICHWIFYHELIKKYPYYRWRKFFVDITLFVLMSIVLRISLFSSFNPVFTLFISLIAFWYFLAYLWHLSDKGLRPVNLYANSLLVKCIIYSSISIIFILFNTIFLANGKHGLETVNNINIYIRWLVVALIVLLNAERLNKFISRKATLSHCCLFYNQDDYSLTEGFPEGYLPQMFAKKLIDLSTEYHEREFEKNIIKENNPGGVQVNKNIFNINQHSAELIEFLIVLCFSRVTGFHDSSFGFKEERIPITEIEHFSNGHDNNTFLNTLHKLTNKIPESNITEFYDLRLPKDIIKQRKICRNKDEVFSNSGVIIMNRGYFCIKIRYERTEHFAYSSSSTLLRLIPWEKIGRLSINPIFSDDHNDDGVMNRKWYTYHIEVDIDVSIATRLHSIFSESISRQLGWSDIIASSFIEFFDINRYMNNLERYQIS
jgi:hypothetical protein